MDAQPVSKKRNWKKTLVVFALALVVIGFAAKGLYDVVVNPLPNISQIQIDLDRNGTSDLDVKNVKVVDNPRRSDGSTILIVEGDAPNFLAQNRQP